MDYIQGLEYVAKLLGGYVDDLDIQIENYNTELFNLQNDLQVFDVEHKPSSSNPLFSPRREESADSVDSSVERTKLVKSINYLEANLGFYTNKKNEVLEAISFLKDTSSYMEKMVPSKDISFVQNQIDNIGKYILSDPQRAALELSSLSKKLKSSNK